MSTEAEPKKIDIPDPEEAWRGVAAEDIDELTAAIGLKLQARSRKLLRSLLAPHRRAVLVALIMVIGENVAGLAGPVLIAAALDTGVPAVIHGRPWPLIWCAVGYLGCGVASALLRYGFLRLSGRIGQDILLDLRRRIFGHAQGLSLSFHESYTSGKIVSRLTSDMDSIDALLDQGLDGLLSAGFTVLGIGIVMLWLDWSLGLIVVLGLVPLLWVTRWFYRSSQHAYRETRGAIAKIIVQFVETMNGMRAVQAFRRERRNEAIMGTLNTSFQEANRKALTVVATFTSTVRMVGNISLALVLAIGAIRVAHGGLEIGVLAAFTLYLRRFYDPLDDLAMFANSYTAASAALEKISGVLEEVPSVPEPVHPVPVVQPRGEIRFAGVEFRYGPDKPVVLPTFDLRIPAGQTVALVGETGAGKSTVAKLVARLYDPSSGGVELDGVDLRRISDADLRKAVAMVTQENFLFSGSVADNIALGRPDATRDEVRAAAEAVGADVFINALPEGYDTDVRKRGGRLSAGQRQMVAFTRALLADPAVLVLDEATSSLDVPTERAVQEALETVLTDRTALIIAHRLSTVLIADRVLVVDGGRIVEDGSPADLVANTGRFADLHNAWLESLA
ncbi:MAG TPA: ABC transporter ATP-binding protein [Pseudonocardiaceae bacterium]|nr:ABC transporter ATP-binding protein [Pseudonocardiaceae bacterium]